MRLKKKEILITHLHYTYKNEISEIFYLTNILCIKSLSLSLSPSLFLCNMQYAYRTGNNEHVCDRNCKSAISA